ncbi:MAG: hypothetical protein DHS80DRAFT_20999 [Piptocephalis tieghemiana]|nr:MAG: hypothetical protein DHS80DRAFT_20999 [Piptocephalis tieghemiana]
MSYARIYPHPDTTLSRPKGKPYGFHLAPASISLAARPSSPSSKPLSGLSVSPPSSVLDDTLSDCSDLDEDTAEDEESVEEEYMDDEKKAYPIPSSPSPSPSSLSHHSSTQRVHFAPSQGRVSSETQEVLRPIYPPQHPLLSPNPPQYRRTAIHVSDRTSQHTRPAPSPELLGTLHHLRLRNQFLSHQHARLVADLAHVKYTVQALRTLVQQKEIMVEKLRSEATDAWDRVKDTESRCSTILAAKHEKVNGGCEDITEEEEKDPSLGIPFPMEAIHLDDSSDPSSTTQSFSVSSLSESCESHPDLPPSPRPRQPTFDTITSDMLPIDRHAETSLITPANSSDKSQSSKGLWSKKALRKIARAAKMLSW